jgi:hypothetical protein
MRVSHESIYRDVYMPSRKAFDASMFHRLRSDRSIRRALGKRSSHGRGQIRNAVSIASDRPRPTAASSLIRRRRSLTSIRHQTPRGAHGLQAKSSPTKIIQSPPNSAVVTYSEPKAALVIATGDPTNRPGHDLHLAAALASKPNGSPSWCRPKTTACSTAAHLEVCCCTVRRVQAPRNELPGADHAPLRRSG